MTYLFPISEVTSTSLMTLAIKCFIFFIPKGKVIGSTSTLKMFDNWLHVLKSGCHKWRLPQNVHRALPQSSHIEMGLNFGKVWYANVQATTLTEL